VKLDEAKTLTRAHDRLERLRAELATFTEPGMKKSPGEAKKTPAGPRPVPVKSEEQPIGEGTMPLAAEQPAATSAKPRANDPCPLVDCGHTLATHAGGPCRAPGCNCWAFGVAEKPAPAKPAAKRGKVAEAVA